jgi:hypothetical protein
MTETKAPNAIAKAPLVGGGMIRAIVPQDFEGAWRIAQVVVAAGMTPKSLNTVEKAVVAIMHGMEVGLTPMASLQSIAVINGNPSIWGDGMLALVQGSGLLEDMEEHTEYDDKGEWQYSTCTMKRVGRKTPVTQMFTRVMAMRAGLLNKEGPWKQYTGRMGQSRARAWCCRDLFPDVLRGLHNTEEMMDRPIDITDRATVTTAPPAEPRRSDFQPASQQQEPDEPKGDVYPLFDETGVQLGELAPAPWYDKMAEEAERMTGPARVAFLENNAEAAKEVWSRLENDEAAAHLKALYEPKEQPADEPATKDWSLPDNIVGQDKKLQAIYKMLDEKTETPADVEDLWSAHEAFLDKLGPLKKAAANERFGNRKMAIAQAQAAS